MKNTQNRIDSIQALRGFAAMLVVLFHYRFEFDSALHGMADFLFRNGFIGVDLFFLISGFIVFYVSNDLNKGYVSSKEFLIKRFCRIIPLYYIITISVSGSSLESWMETIRSMLFIPSGKNEQGPFYGYARLDVGWTLNYEIFFYILASFSILFKRFKWLILSLLILALTIAPSFYFGYNHLDPQIGYSFNNTYLKLMTNPLLIEFLFGVIIGWLYLKEIKIENKIFWTTLLFISIFVFLSTYFSNIFNGHGVMNFMLPSAFLLFSITQYEKRFPIKWNKWIIKLGTMSFSIYLIHTQVLSVINKIFLRIQAPEWLTALVSIFMTVYLANFTYKYIEVKLSQSIRKKLLKI